VERKHNPKKRHGGQQDCFCSSGTGAVLAANILHAGQSENFSLIRCLGIILGIFVHAIDLLRSRFNSIIALDRGYSFLKNLVTCNTVGVRHLSGVKMDVAPHKVKGKSNPRAKIGQREIPDIGYASSYFALQKSATEGGVVQPDVLHTCLRNGSGQLVHLQNHLTDIQPWQLDYDFNCIDETAAEYASRTTFAEFEHHRR
jgi:hypothetical protein